MRVTYVIKDKLTGYYKIGRTSNLKKRFSTLSTSNLNLEISYVFPEDIEKMLHINFKKSNIAKEWYCLSYSEVQQLEELKEEYFKQQL